MTIEVEHLEFIMEVEAGLSLYLVPSERKGCQYWDYLFIRNGVEVYRSRVFYPSRANAVYFGVLVYLEGA